MSSTTTKRGLVAAAMSAALVTSLAGATAAQDEEITLTYLVDTTEVTQAEAKAVADAYTALHPNVTFEFELRPQGEEGDGLVRTRLATGEMTDVFWYNAGALFQALPNKSETMVDISGEPCMENIDESFLQTVSDGEAVYGVPSEPGMGGGILYNKRIYEDLGLDVPTTWEQFEANNEAIKAAGIAPVGATFAGDSTWTAQLFVLADYVNVQAAEPDFAERYTANEAKYATSPAALKGFQRLQEAYEAGWFQEDFGAASYADGLIMLAEGDVAHYPMLSFALPSIAETHPDAVGDIGFFGQPGDDAATNGATLWMPAATYIAATSEHVDVAKDFLCFVASAEGVDAVAAAVAPQGPMFIKGATLPDDVLPAVQDIQAYVEAGATAPALEFLSPVKGPNLPQITTAVGSGLETAESGAALYDEDVKQAALQLGLPGWEE